MNNFKKAGFRKGGSGLGGKPSFGDTKRFGGGERGGERGFGGNNRPAADREFFKATCASCHKACEVPFRPTGDKPVYCRECFANKAPSDGRMGGRGGDFKRESRSFRDERPAHKDVRDVVKTPRDTGTDDIKRQLAKLEAKVDTILARLINKGEELAKVRGPITLTVEGDTETPGEATPKKARKPKSAKPKAPAKKKVTKKKGK